MCDARADTPTAAALAPSWDPRGSTPPTAIPPSPAGSASLEPWRVRAGGAGSLRKKKKGRSHTPVQPPPSYGGEGVWDPATPSTHFLSHKQECGRSFPIAREGGRADLPFPPLPSSGHGQKGTRSQRSAADPNGSSAPSRRPPNPPSHHVPLSRPWSPGELSRHRFKTRRGGGSARNTELGGGRA